MSKPTSRSRYARPPSGSAGVIPDGVDPATVVQRQPPHVTVAEQRRRNRPTVGRSDSSLHCLEPGCRERIAELEFYVGDGGPRFRMAIHAPWVNAETSDPDVRSRFRLTGAFDPEASPVFLEFVHWTPGSRVEIVCRNDHESRIDQRVLQRWVRRASVESVAG